MGRAGRLPSYEGSGLKLLYDVDPTSNPSLPSHEGSGLKSVPLLVDHVFERSPLA